jgi:uncharacterized protein YukE
MSTKLTTDIINQATDKVNNYVDTVTKLYNDLKSVVDNITTNGFKGEASTGFLEFFNTNMVPMLTENLTGDASVTASLKKLLDDINNTLIVTVDPTLGNANKNAGGTAGGTTTGTTSTT